MKSTINGQRSVPVRVFEDGTEITVNPRSSVSWSNNWEAIHDNPKAYGLKQEFGGPGTFGHVSLVLINP